MTEEYDLCTYDRHELNYDNVALGRLPYKVTEDPMVTPRELVYLPKGVMEPHDLPLMPVALVCFQKKFCISRKQTK